MKAIENRAAGQAEMFCQSHHAISDAFNSQNAMALFCRGGPSAVCWLVIAIIVNSVQRPAIGLVSHVSQKVFKLLPTFANGDAAATVTVKVFDVGILTAIKHVRPTSVGRSVRAAVLDGRCPRTATGTVRPQSCEVHNFFHAAVASNHDAPKYLSTRRQGVRRVGDYDKASKSLSDVVLSVGRHNVANSNVVLSGGSSATTDSRCVNLSVN